MLLVILALGTVYMLYDFLTTPLEPWELDSTDHNNINNTKD